MSVAADLYAVPGGREACLNAAAAIYAQAMADLQDPTEGEWNEHSTTADR